MVQNIKRKVNSIPKARGSSCGNSTKCKCCSVISPLPSPKVVVNGQEVALPSGTCKSKNIIYLAKCNLCNDKCYVGRTVQALHKRVFGHRQSFTTVVDKGLNYVNS